MLVEVDVSVTDVVVEYANIDSADGQRTEENTRVELRLSDGVVMASQRDSSIDGNFAEVKFSSSRSNSRPIEVCITSSQNNLAHSGAMVTAS